MVLDLEDAVHPADQRIVDAHWAATFDRSTDTFASPLTQICPAKSWQRPESAFVFNVSGRQTLIAVRDEIRDAVIAALGGVRVDECLTAEDLVARIGRERASIAAVGYLLYLPNDWTSPPTRIGLRRLQPADLPDLERLRQACSRSDLDAAQIEDDQPVIVGAWQAGELASAAGFIYYGEHDRIADVGVLTHPNYRGSGLGKAVVAALASIGQDEGRIVQYEADETNQASLAIARSLGFVEYARESSIVVSSRPTAERAT